MLLRNFLRSFGDRLDFHFVKLDPESTTLFLLIRVRLVILDAFFGELARNKCLQSSLICIAQRIKLNRYHFKSNLTQKNPPDPLTIREDNQLIS